MLTGLQQDEIVLQISSTTYRSVPLPHVKKYSISMYGSTVCFYRLVDMLQNMKYRLIYNTISLTVISLNILQSVVFILYKDIQLLRRLVASCAG